MEVVLLHNPGAGKDHIPLAALERMLERAGFQPRSFSLNDDLDPRVLRELGAFVVVAGSDGSIRRIALQLAHTGRAIAIIESIDEVSHHDYAHREDEIQRDLSVFPALAHEMAPVPLGLEIDGRDARDSFLLLEILNIPRAGPRLELAAGADLADGFLDVISVTTAERD